MGLQATSSRSFGDQHVGAQQAELTTITRTTPASQIKEACLPLKARVPTTATKHNLNSTSSDLVKTDYNEESCARLLASAAKNGGTQRTNLSLGVGRASEQFKFNKDLPSPEQLLAASTAKHRAAESRGTSGRRRNSSSSSSASSCSDGGSGGDNNAWKQVNGDDGNDREDAEDQTDKRLSVYENANLPSLPVGATDTTNLAPESVTPKPQATPEQASEPVAPRARPKLVAMTSIIHEPEDDLMCNVQQVSTAAVQHDGDKTSRRESNFSWAENSGIGQQGAAAAAATASSNYNSDSDSSLAPLSGKRRLVRKFEQLARGGGGGGAAVSRKPAAAAAPAPDSASKHKQAGQEDEASARKPPLAPRPAAAGSLVKRLARNFDQPSQQAQRPEVPRKPASLTSGPAVVAAPLRVSTQLVREDSQERQWGGQDEPKSDSTWYDAKSVELLDEAEVAELLREFDSPQASNALAEAHALDDADDATTLDDEATLNEDLESGGAAAGNAMLDEEVSLTYASAATNLATESQRNASGDGAAFDTKQRQGNDDDDDGGGAKREEDVQVSQATSRDELSNGDESVEKNKMLQDAFVLAQNDDDDEREMEAERAQLQLGERAPSQSAPFEPKSRRTVTSGATAAQPPRAPAKPPTQSAVAAAAAPQQQQQQLPSQRQPSTLSPCSKQQDAEQQATPPAVAAAAAEHTRAKRIVIDQNFKNNLEKLIENNNNITPAFLTDGAGDGDGNQHHQQPPHQAAVGAADGRQQNLDTGKHSSGGGGLDNEAPPERRRNSRRRRQLVTRELARYCRFMTKMARVQRAEKPQQSTAAIGGADAAGAAAAKRPRAQLEDYIHSSSEEEEDDDESSCCGDDEEEGEDYDDDDDGRSSSFCSAIAASECDNEDDEAGAKKQLNSPRPAKPKQNPLGQLDTKHLLKAAKECSRLYDELERLLARRAEEERSKQLIHGGNVQNEPQISESRAKASEPPKGAHLSQRSLNAASLVCQDQRQPGLGKANDVDQISLSSSSISSESMPEIRQRQNLQKLYNIVNEIYTSEAKFVDTLRLLNVDFRNHIGANIPVNQCELASHLAGALAANQQPPFDCVQKMLKHLPQLQALNENLLSELKRARDEWPKTQKISHILVKIGPFLKHYSSYIRDFETVQQQFQENLKRYPNFSEIIRQFESSERCQKLSIQHHLLKPIQRIPQYRLLLQQYLHHLKPDDQDYEDTVSALEVVSRVAEHANQSMNDGINFAKLLALQAKIVGKQRDIVQPGRVFIKEGELIKVSRKQRQPRWFILLNDALLYLTQIQSSDILYLKYELPLGLNCQVQTASERAGVQNLIGQQFETEFNICTPARSFTLVAKSKFERDDWVACLRRAIQDHEAKLRTFSASGTVASAKPTSDCCALTSGLSVQEAVSPGCADQLGVEACAQLQQQQQQQLQQPLLGTQAPLWTPDSRVTMCQLCTSNFSALFRRHHCRACGRVVCSACSSNKAPLIYLKCRSARVCDQCFESLRSNMHLYYLPSSRCQLASQINERELKRLDEHFKTLLKSQFLKHTGFERIKRARQQHQATKATSAQQGALLGLQHSSSSASSLSMTSDSLNVSLQGSAAGVCRARSKPLLCGHLHKRHHKKPKWKRQWFVIRENLLEVYRAIDDVAPVDSLPLLGFEVDQPACEIDGLEARCLIRLRHPKLLVSPSSSPPMKLTAAETSKCFRKMFLEHLFRAEDQQAAARWLEALRKATQMQHAGGVQEQARAAASEGAKKSASFGS